MNAADIRVDYADIEKTLTNMWRDENANGKDAVVRAALWNVVAHTSSTSDHTHASETLCKAAVSVPQRTIVIRSEPEAAPDMTSWVSANCHLIGDSKQVCSEEIDIIAGGDRIHHVAPIINALLLPDMPVAFWWVGDLPNTLEDYVETLLEPVDRLIFDSAFFDRPEDFALITRITEQTTTEPADLNWVRLEEWRQATARLFDREEMRTRAPIMKAIEVVAVAGGTSFGDRAEAFLYAAWVVTQLRQDETKIEYRLRTEPHPECRAGSLLSISIEFANGSALLKRDEERGVIMTTADGAPLPVDAMTRMQSRSLDDVIVRQLKRTSADHVFVKVLPVATKLAKRLCA